MAVAYFAFGDLCQVRKRHLKDRLYKKLVVDDLRSWKVIKLGSLSSAHQHSQLCKHKLGIHKHLGWRGTREAITIRRPQLRRERRFLKVPPRAIIA